MLRAGLDAWMTSYTERGTRQGRWCYGKTPKQTFLDSVGVARGKQDLVKAA